jgi:excisionase family DNA binding protein
MVVILMGTLLQTISDLDGGEDLSGEVAPRLLKIETVATLCEVSKRTVYRWLNREGLPAHRIPGVGARPILRIAQTDLDAWLQRHRHDPEVEKAATQRTLRLDGIRFMQPAPPDSGKHQLDTRRTARPVCGPHGRRSP